MNLELHKNKIFENRKSYTDCTNALNISTTSFSNKMNPNETGKPEFKVSEVIKLSDLLNLTREEKETIFFKK